MVTTPLSAPSATAYGVMDIEELAASGVRLLNTTFAVLAEMGLDIEIVFVSAVVDFKLQVESPSMSVTVQVEIVLLDPVDEKLTFFPLTGLL